MDWSALVERFVAARHPEATIAVIAGSTARGERTSTSDVDLVLIGPPAMLAGDVSSMAETVEFEGELVEVFAYTSEGFDEWARRDVAEFRAVIAKMLLEGRAVRRTPELDRLRAHWAPILARGPSPDARHIDRLRYEITGLLDDLVDSSDTLEQQVVAALLFTRTAELALLSNHQWIGTGKQLPRRLREWEARRAAALAEPFINRDIVGLATAVIGELDLVGGRLQAGFVRARRT